MSDVQDMVVRAIQSYTKDWDETFEVSKTVLRGLAEPLAAHVIKELGLQQEFGIAHTYTYINDDDERCEQIDYINNESENYEWVAEELLLRQDWSIYDDTRCYVATSLHTEWTEVQELDLDPDLVKLVSDDG